MSINKLPDDCLLVIFSLINGLDDLLNCYKVCSKWSHLIAERTRKVKYLVEHEDDWPDKEPFLSYPFDYVYYRSKKPIDESCLSTLFPNLMIADLSGLLDQIEYEDIVTWVEKMKPLKGLIDEVYNEPKSILQYFNQLEMVSSSYIEPCMEENGVNIKQLRLIGYKLDRFSELATQMATTMVPYWDTVSPILRGLKIVELFLSSIDGLNFNYDFQFIDSCPNLQSAHIYLQPNRIFVDESVKHESLQDLVIEFHLSDYNHSFNWNDWKSLFMKYPNLEHLALRNNNSLKNKHVEQLIHILPNLVLFDVRDCPKVTQEAANYVQDYNKLHGQYIKFYFNDNHQEILSDWPHLSTKCEKISQGFDFMKNCFLKSFRSIPTFLVSSEPDA